MQTWLVRVAGKDNMSDMILTGKGKKHSRQDREKQLFFLILILSFFAILVFNVLTPMLSDDYAYAMEVQKAGSLADLFRQEYHQYMTWNGRSVVHFILRVFLFLPSWVFKLANSAAFVAVSLLMWKLTEPDREYDCYTLLMVQLGLWLYAVDFSETILWEDGACNYLWGALLILLFMVMERRTLMRQASFHLSEALGLLLLGILAGWCNENTSGGCLLYLLILAAEEIRKNTKSRKGRGEENSRKKRSEGVIPATYLAGLCGNILGLAMMVLSPGGRLRASYAEEENYQGILGLLARVQKITLTIHEYFGLLLAVFAVCLVLLILQKNRMAYRRMLLYLVLFLATSYALVATRQTQPRAFFGAGLFLMIGLICGLREMMKEKERENRLLLQAAGYGILAVLLLQFFFVYVEEGTNLARIYRDETNRIAYIEEQRSLGKEEIVVPLVHSDFYNPYSAIEKMEMTDDPGYWINIFYEEYYGVPSIRAIPYDDWVETNGS